MNITFLILFFISFFITFFIEGFAYKWILEKGYIVFGYSFLINLLSLSLAKIILSLAGISWFILVAEFIVFLIEIPLIKYLMNVSWGKSLVTSLIANFVTGFLTLFWM